MKVNRQAVYKKYDGHCAYCGKEIKYEDMQVDHLFPKAKESWTKHERVKKHPEIYGNIPNDINEFNNLMPSCRRCNHYKRSNSLAIFRRLLSTIHKRLMKIYIVKVAVDYGIVEIKPFSNKFYFEGV